MKYQISKKSEWAQETVIMITEEPTAQEIATRTEMDLPVFAEHFVFCTHPVDALPAINELLGTSYTIKDFGNYVKIHSKNPDWRTLPDEAISLGKGKDEHLFTFIWHGHSALSALAWFDYIRKNVTEAQASEILDFCDRCYM